MALAGTGLGLYYSRRLYRRVDYLSQVCRLLEALCHRLSYEPQPLAALWTGLAKGDAFSGFTLVQDTVLCLEEVGFYPAFAQAVKRAAAAGWLTEGDKELLLAFGEGCGRLGLSQQVAQTQACCRQMEQARDAAREQASAKGQVYQMLGVAGGVSLALLLL